MYAAPKCKIVELDTADLIATSDPTPRISRRGDVYSDIDEDAL